MTNEGLKCSGCKWFNCTSADNHLFCKSPKNIGAGSDCYEQEEKSIATTKIDYVRNIIVNLK